MRIGIRGDSPMGYFHRVTEVYRYYLAHPSLQHVQRMASPTTTAFQDEFALNIPRLYGVHPGPELLSQISILLLIGEGLPLPAKTIYGALVFFLEGAKSRNATLDGPTLSTSSTSQLPLLYLFQAILSLQDNVPPAFWTR
jgi:hypothetical protein